MTLDQLKIGQSARIDTVGGEGALRQHLLDMGVIPGAELTLVRLAPMGDPVEVRIHGYELTLRLADAAKIGLTPLGDGRRAERPFPKERPVPHPNLGEPGIHHDKRAEPLPESHVLTFALVGNQNSGKTTLFNQLTGSNQHVGNFPGVTVDRKDGVIRGHARTRITDLPGIYSMSPYTGEEIVSRDFVLHERPDALINIVDATSFERSLMLAMQLLEMDRPMVIALNMMDELTGNGGSVDINAMEAMLGVPVVPISAAKNQGVDELVTHALHVARYQEKPQQQDVCAQDDHSGAVHRCLHAVATLIEDHAERAGLPLRFAASKAIEGDEQILTRLALDSNEREMLEHITLQMEAERGLDRSAAIADMRYTFIDKVSRACIVKLHLSREHLRSQRMDTVLAGKYTAIPVFVLIMALVFMMTFSWIGPWLQGLLAEGIGAMTLAVDAALRAGRVNPVIHGLIVGGVFEGIGSVISFLPIVVLMFFFLSLLEDSGYIARVAFVMDKLLRRIGLSGRSIVPMLIGFGCSVPAVMATRTLPSERDRRMTILLTPFISCTAKLPVYGFLCSAFFPDEAGLLVIALYLGGILMGILSALLYKRTLFAGEAVPFVMELPNYRIPSLRTTLQLMWEKSCDFLQRAFSIILLASVVVWFLKSFDLRFNLTQNPDESLMAALSEVFVPLLTPIGLGDWRIATALIGGFMAKESVVSVMEVLFGGEGGIVSALTTTAAGSLLLFSLLYTPCVAAIVAVRREMGRRWALAMVLWQCALAWGVSWLFVQAMTFFA